MQPFDFHQPASIPAAVDAVRAAVDGRFLAGGQSLLPIMKLDLAQPSDLVSLASLDELAEIRAEAGELRLGAMLTHAAVAASTRVRDALPGLAELASQIGDPQVRNRGTLGGSLAHADPAADYPAAILALDAVLVTDRREIPAAEFFLGPYETSLEAAELVTGVRVPIPQAAAYAKFPQPASKFALVGVFVARATGGVRVAVTGARGHVFRAEALESALSTDFSPQTLENLDVPAEALLDNPDASAEYRAHLIGVMARRAVAACLA